MPKRENGTAQTLCCQILCTDSGIEILHIATYADASNSFILFWASIGLLELRQNILLVILKFKSCRDAS